MTKEEFIAKFYSSDNEEQFLKDVYHNLNSLEKQLEYLRSGEYLNQLKFERNMLEDIVQNMEVSKEDKEFIDMTHRNTELLEENQLLKRNCNIGNENLNFYRQENIQLKERMRKASAMLRHDINFSELCDGYEILKILKGEENE